MSRKFQDENFLIWEVYPSASRFGFSVDPSLIFNCLTDRQVRPRYVVHEGDEADAQRTIVLASQHELMDMLRRSREIR
jgi:hypothetical protein